MVLSDFDLSPPSKIFASLTLSLRTSVHTPHLCSFLFAVTNYYNLGGSKVQMIGFSLLLNLIVLAVCSLFKLDLMMAGREGEGGA